MYRKTKTYVKIVEFL